MKNKKKNRNETFTVEDMIKILSQFDGKMEVRVEDTFWAEEGYGDHSDDIDYLTRPLNHHEVISIKGKDVLYFDYRFKPGRG